MGISYQLEGVAPPPGSTMERIRRQLTGRGISVS
ncbi:hypothetical protein J2Z79_003239 [Symbiobacterium terraclitae]|uniref:Uncharacterized protein n=1 Tax=Symbiobacterium terraclitae TaxID=557451 RepID=A0ABS4JW78_9FIRM|nr:hypothetical protein [Symbiobacterium terraclitae]